MNIIHSFALGLERKTFIYDQGTFTATGIRWICPHSQMLALYHCLLLLNFQQVFSSSFFEYSIMTLQGHRGKLF